jgi:hypothetical protein
VVVPDAGAASPLIDMLFPPFGASPVVVGTSSSEILRLVRSSADIVGMRMSSCLEGSARPQRIRNHEYTSDAVESRLTLFTGYVMLLARAHVILA